MNRQTYRYTHTDRKRMRERATKRKSDRGRLQMSMNGLENMMTE